MAFLVEYRYWNDHHLSWPNKREYATKDEMERAVSHLVHCVSHITAVAVDDHLAWLFADWNEKWIANHPACVPECKCSYQPSNRQQIINENIRQNFIDDHGFSPD